MREREMEEMELINRVVRNNNTSKKKIGRYELMSMFVVEAPLPLRSLQPSAFSPQMVAIGPSNKPWDIDAAKLPQAMDRHKLASLKALLQDLQNGGFDLHQLLSTISREMASHTSKWDDSNPILNTRQLALDASFILSILTSPIVFPQQKAKPTLALSNVHLNTFSRHVIRAIIHDFFLLENQIPLFLLTKLLHLVLTKSKPGPSHPRNFTPEEEEEEERGEEEDAERWLEERITFAVIHVLPFARSPSLIRNRLAKLAAPRMATPHLLHCLYTIATFSACESDSKEEDEEEDVVLTPAFVPNATCLYNMGVRFSGHDESLVEIAFDPKKDQLSLPRIYIDASTDRIFRNLLAYEGVIQLHNSNQVHVLSYLHFMNCLINTAHDVSLLVEAGVITETIGSNKQVAKMWNRLTINTTFVFSKRYNDVAQATDNYCKGKIRGLTAEFYRRYLMKPWVPVIVFSTTTFLLLTFLTLWYIFLLYQKKKDAHHD